MHNLLGHSDGNAIAILKHDHQNVKELFKKFKKTDSLKEKKKIAAEAIMELKIHAEIEEKIFYPSVRKQLDSFIMNEADEEHHVTKLLIAELDQMSGKEDHWEAKFTVLAENIRHHIKEEESQMLPKARKLDMDFDVLGQKLLLMKKQLKKNGIPPCAEEKLMQRNQEANSPVQAAKKTSSLSTRTRKPSKPKGETSSKTKKTQRRIGSTQKSKMRKA